MLIKLFNKIASILIEGRIVSIDHLSESIGVSPAVTQAMIDDLVRRGFLSETGFSEENKYKTSCKGCVCSCSCSCSTDSIRAWELSDKVKLIQV